MSAQERLAEIKARAGAATDGPWEAVTSEATMNNRSQWRIGRRDRPQVARSVMADQDAHFIAHARTDIPRLAAALEAVLELHKPREVETTRGDCAVQECEHEEVYDCPTYPYEVCAACDDLATEVDGYYSEEKLALTAHPCPTVQAVNDALEAHP